MKSLVASALFLVACPAFGFDVTTCGQTVPDYEDAVLLNDLDCSAGPGREAITLSRSSTIDLRGFTITAPVEGSAVHCEFGDGRILYNPYVFIPPKGSCEVTSTTGIAHLAGAIGISSDKNLVVSNVSIAPTWRGIYMNNHGTRLTATNVTIEGGSDDGIFARNMLLENVTVTNAGEVGIYALRNVRGTNVTVSGNGQGGIWTHGKLNLTGLVSIDNGGDDPIYLRGGGVVATRITLYDSLATGNLYGSSAVDLLSWRLPVLSSTVCGSSSVDGSETPQSWGVCDND